MSISSKGQVGAALANAQTAHALRQKLRGLLSGQASHAPARMTRRPGATSEAIG